MDVQEYRKLAAAIKQRDLTLPQNGIKFKFGDFTCEQGNDGRAQCLWARDTAAEITCISDFIAIYQSDNTIRDASMPADRIWELIKHFPLKEEYANVEIFADVVKEDTEIDAETDIDDKTNAGSESNPNNTSISIQEYEKLVNAIKQRNFTLPQSGIDFMFGSFKCLQGKDAANNQCLWAHDTTKSFAINDFIAIHQSDNTIRDMSMPADRAWDLIKHFPLKKEYADVAKKEDVEPIKVDSIKIELTTSQ